MGDKRRALTPEELKAFWDRVNNEVISPNAQAIAEIVASGDDIAVAMHDVDPEMHDLARLFGWDGRASVFQMSGRARAVQRFKEIGDPVTAAWLSRRGTHRMFLFSGIGTLLLNFEEGKGWSIEPGSTDAEFMN